VPNLCAINGAPINGSAGAAVGVTLGVASGVEVANAIRAATSISATESLVCAEVFDPPLWGVSSAESLSVGAATIQNATSKPVLTSGLGLAGALATAWPLAIADTATISPSLITARGLTVAEALGLTPSTAPATTYGVSTAEALGLSEALLKFLGGALTEGLTVTPAVTADRCAGSVFSDALSVGDTAAATAVLRVVTAEGLDLTDAQLMQSIFSGTLTEEIILSLGVLDDAGDFTAWALNTVTGGVTQYENYLFNSYAAHGGQYLAASESGLYTLDGDTDDGTDIVGTLRSGYTQFAGTKLSVLDAAYLGLRGDGCYVFNIHTGTGEQYGYTAYAESMRTARVTLGRGLRTRYIAFELVSTGQDFDLDSVELTPLDLTRRV